MNETKRHQSLSAGNVDPTHDGILPDGVPDRHFSLHVPRQFLFYLCYYYHYNRLVGGPLIRHVIPANF